MIGYGVSNTTTANQMASSMGFNINPIATNSEPQNYVNINAPKKELSLAEKQQMANKLENENGPANLKASKSMTDSFMNKNLADLSSLNNQPPLAITNSSSNKNNFDFFSELETNSLSQHQSKNINNNNNLPGLTTNTALNKQNNFNGSFNTNDHSNGINQFKNMSLNNNSSQIQRSSSSQQGFFGNLALPAPPSMTSLMDTNKNKATTIPNIAPPPLKPMQAAINLNNFNASKSNNNSKNKKSALDDLNDLFG